MNRQCVLNRYYLFHKDTNMNYFTGNLIEGNLPDRFTEHLSETKNV